MAVTKTGVIKIQIDTDKLVEADAWQPTLLDDTLGSLGSFAGKVPLVGSKIAGGTNAVTSLVRGVDTGADLVQGALSPAAIVALVATLTTKSIQEIHDYVAKGKQADEMQRRAYGERE